MYELNHISCTFQRILRFMRNCDNFLYPWEQAKAQIFDCSLCRSELFPVFYWTVLLLSLAGAAIRLKDLVYMMTCPMFKLAMTRKRDFYLLDENILRKARLVGCSVTVATWLMLIYGILMVSPSAMGPWIWLTSLVVLGDWVILSFELATRRLKIDMPTILSVVLPTINLAMVRCVRKVFVAAISEPKDHWMKIIFIYIFKIIYNDRLDHMQ